jgi:hypothetical protein
VECKAALRKLLRHGRGIQFVEHTEGDGDEMFKAVCKLGLEGIVSKKLNAPYKSGPSKAWLKIKNPKAPAATRAVDGTFYRQFIVAILLVVAVPVYAHAQNLRVGDAQKVVTIISSDKVKTQSYCEIMKLGEQVGQAYEKNDRKMVDELSQKIDTLEKILGPEYVALINGVQEIRENDQLRAEFLSAFGALARLCTR